VSSKEEIVRICETLYWQISYAERYFKLYQFYEESVFTDKRHIEIVRFLHLTSRSLQESTMACLLRFYYYGDDSLGIRTYLKKVGTYFKSNPETAKGVSAEEIEKEVLAHSKKDDSCDPELKRLLYIRDKYFSHYDLDHVLQKADLPKLEFLSLWGLIENGKRLLFKYSEYFVDPTKSVLGLNGYPLSGVYGEANEFKKMYDYLPTKGTKKEGS
jgi:hypothetical protein